MSHLSHDTMVIQTGGQPEPGEVVEGCRRAAKRTQIREEWWRGPGGHPNALRVGRSGGGCQEGSQTHSDQGRVVEGARRAAKRTQSREEWWRGQGGQPNALSTGRSGGGGQESSQTHSEPGGVVEGARRAAKRT